MNRLAGLLETVDGCWQLIRLLILSRFRLSGRYWTWRNETAFGRGKPADRSESIKATLDYGRWMARVRKVGRSRY